MTCVTITATGGDISQGKQAAGGRREMAGRKPTLAGVIADAALLSDGDLANLASWLQREREARAQQPGAAGSHVVREERGGKRTYRLELVTCGNEGCHCMTGGALHGPYWYWYKKEGGRVKKGYIGKNTPAELADEVR